MYKIDDLEFIDLVEQGIPIEILERRLWPALDETGEWREHTKNFTLEEWDESKDVFSGMGFLGMNENLFKIIYSDWLTVEKYGTSHKAIGESLDKLFEDQYQLHPDYEFIDEEIRVNIIEELQWQSYSVGGWEGCPWGHGIYNGDSGIIIKKGISDDETIEACLHTSLGIDNSTYEWIDNLSNMQEFSQIAQQMKRIKDNYERKKLSMDIEITYAPLTKLLPHLIKEHYFFEGKETRYRADPEFIISALNLANTS